MGSFEADISAAGYEEDAAEDELDCAGVDCGSRARRQSPLVREGEEYVPNISHVFRQDQHLYLLYEIYDPSREKAADAAKGAKPGIDLLSSLELIQRDEGV